MDTPIVSSATHEDFAQPYNANDPDLSNAPVSPLLQALTDLANEDPSLVPDLAQPAPPAPPAPAADEPEVIQLEGGAFIEIAKSGSKWKASLNPGPGGGNIENFYGKTKNELFSNLAVAKLNATRKIRDLNRKQKLGINQPAPAAPAPAAPAPRALTADEVFQIKNQLQADPALAFDTLFQKRTGMTFEQLTDILQRGQRAEETLECESVAREFVRTTPEYLTSDANFEAIVAWLMRNKLNKNLTSQNQNSAVGELHRAGFWTTDSLTEAYEDLLQDGLLETAPDEPAPAPPAPPVASAPPSPRIVDTVRRPRAGLGIRGSEVSAPPAAARSLTAEDLSRMTPQQRTAALDQLSDKEVHELMEATRALHRQRGTRA